MSLLKSLLDKFAASLYLLLILLGLAMLYAGFNLLSYQQKDNSAHLQQKKSYLAAIAEQDAQTAPRPNIIFILYDDLGYGDIGPAANNVIDTPNLDSIAANGISLSQFYSPAAVCTPARAAILTGRLPPRAGLPDVVFPTDHPISLFTRATFGGHLRLPAEEITLADVLKAAGYKTAMIGKWHLGDRSPSLPNDMGFDEYFGALYSNDMTPFALYRDRAIEIPAPADQTRLSEVYAREAVAFVQRQSEQPFFLYLAHNFPHRPLHIRPERAGTSAAGLYGDVLEELDEGVGQLLAALEERGVLDNTLLIITSDNGPWYLGSAGPTRGRKGDTFEGGMRVPFLIQWPKHLASGQQIAAMAMGTDILPTLLDWLHLPLPTDRIIDGLSLVSMLEQHNKGLSAQSPHDYLYFYASDTLQAVRDQRFKYQTRKGVAYGPDPIPLAYKPLQGPWLFDLKNDPTESYDSSLHFPEEAHRLEAAYTKKLKEMNDNRRGWR